MRTVRKPCSDVFFMAKHVLYVKKKMIIKNKASLLNEAYIAWKATLLTAVALDIKSTPEQKQVYPILHMREVM
jgi:hypothetical protein